MPFKKGHSGYKKPEQYRTTPGNPKDKHGTLDLYNVKSKFKKIKKGQKLLDPEEVNYYLQNNMDVTELYGSDEEWELGDWYDEDGKKVSYHIYRKKKQKRNENM